MSNDLIGRRSLLKAAMFGAMAATVSGLSAEAGAASAPAAAPALAPLALTDPQAKALGYVDDSTKVTNPIHQAGQMCATCIQYQGKPGDARGGCNIYPGKSVNSKGWCTVWAKKAA
jgi:hypothetical protein